MSKLIADKLKKVNVTFLKRESYFSGMYGRSGKITWTNSLSGQQDNAHLKVSKIDNEMYLYVSHYITGGGEKRERKILLTTSPCNYGGERYWFVCPTPYCGKRTGTLYIVGEHIACRHCHNLTYDSRNEARRYRRFVSSPDLDEQLAKVGYAYYRNKPTKKYARYLQLLDRFNMGIMGMCKSTY
jgi:hypothetical protein